MRDAAKFRGVRPAAAEGRVRLELTDPVTGKVKERVEGKNHVFEDALFSGTGFDWVSSVSAAWMALNDNDANIDPDMPFLLGDTVGYGIPGQGTKGTVRGAYNAANQVLAAMTLESVRWKFQYDFTTAQANGTPIQTIGLTNQYASVPKESITGFRAGAALSNVAGNTCDGRYCYTCSTDGIVTKSDLLAGTSVYIDVSGVVGTTSNSYKWVGYAPATDKYYIYVYSATAALRKMYVFLDNSFGTLEDTYSPSNVAMTGPATSPMYIHGNYAYFFLSSNLHKADFINNISASVIALNVQNAGLVSEYSTLILSGLNVGSVPFRSRYICFGASGTSNYRVRPIFDLSNDAVVGIVYVANAAVFRDNPFILHPLAKNVLPCAINGINLYSNTAIAAYKLPEPITKTSANGMTATYELEVFWE